MSGRYKWHRHPKAVVEFIAPTEEAAPPPPPPPGPFVEGPSYQFHDAQNSMYVAVGI